MWDWEWPTVSDMFSPLLDAIKAGVCWLFTMLLDMLITVAEMLVSSFPELPTWPVATFIVWVSHANVWLPLDAALDALIAWVTFRYVYIAIRWVLKVMPLVG